MKTVLCISNSQLLTFACVSNYKHSPFWYPFFKRVYPLLPNYKIQLYVIRSNLCYCLLTLFGDCNYFIIRSLKNPQYYIKRNVKTPLHQKLHEQSILACFRLIPKNHPSKNKLQLRPRVEQLGNAAKCN